MDEIAKARGLVRAIQYNPKSWIQQCTLSLHRDVDREPDHLGNWRYFPVGQATGTLDATIVSTEPIDFSDALNTQRPMAFNWPDGRMVIFCRITRYTIAAPVDALFQTDVSADVFLAVRYGPNSEQDLIKKLTPPPHQIGDGQP